MLLQGLTRAVALAFISVICYIADTRDWQVVKVCMKEASRLVVYYVCQVNGERQ